MADNYFITLDKKSIKGVNISRYGDGYNYASLTCGMGKDERMNISYEWMGPDIPEFAMTAMDIMKNMGPEKASASTEPEDIAYYERMVAYFSDKVRDAKAALKDGE